jgi:outer membrane lipoprotein-sorting protein
MLTSIKNRAIALQAAAAVLLLSATGAFAQATDPFTTAMTEATSKVGTYAAALVGLSAVAVIFMIAMKYIKKIRGAA